MMEISEIDETIKRICSHRGVIGIIVTSRDGTPIRTTMDNTSTLLYITGLSPIEERCSSIVRDVDPTNRLEYVRIRSKRFEIMVKTEPDYLLYVIQNPTGTS